jgi:prepilin-type N-terminal cleavage/methylation domain-containing protein
MRKAVSLIELIIAIVVMGIAVMSLPLILTQTQSNNALALQQEAILSTKAKIGFISSYPWDQNSWDGTGGIFRVLDTSASPSADNAFATADIRRFGHIQTDKRRRLWDVGHANRAPNNEVTAAPNEDDIDDFNNHADDINITDPTQMDYIFELTMTPEIVYLRDSLNAGSNYLNTRTIQFDFNAINTETNTSRPTNIKMITVRTVSQVGNDVNVSLRSFASNIGQSKISKRDW